jgi:multiple sugar transport system permease protein
MYCRDGVRGPVSAVNKWAESAGMPTYRPVHRPRPRLWVEDRRAAIALAAPCILVLLIVTVFPLLYSLKTAFSYSVLYKPQAEHFVGFQNFEEVLSSNYAAVAFRNTLVYTIVTVVSEMVIGFFFGVFLTLPMYFSTGFRTLLMVPILLSPIIVGLSWRFMYNPNIGIVNQMLATIGLPGPHWLESPALAFWAVMIPDVWQWTPFVTLVTLAGLHGISADIHEAALLDGLRLRHLIWHIYVPLLTPVLIVVLLIRVIDGVRTFDSVFILTQGGPGLATMLISIRAWILGLINLNFGQAAALSYLLLLFVSILVAIFIRVLGQRVS